MKQFFAKEISSSEKNRVGPIGSADNKESFLIRRHRKESEAKLNSAIRKQKGVTLIELLVVVAILAILGGITGLFLLKYLPEYHLRAAAKNLSQDLKYTQVNALKTLKIWKIEFDEPNNSYIIKDASSNIIKKVDLKTYPYQIKFFTSPPAKVEFNAEGFIEGGSNSTIQIENSKNSIIKTTITRTGSIRVTK